MIEFEIISTVCSENRYQEVSFLDKGDFSDKECQMLWGVLKAFNGDIIEVVKSLDQKGRESYSNTLKKAFIGSSATNLQRLSVYLVEKRFKDWFITLLEDLIAKSQNIVEKARLVEALNSCPKQDIFVLSDNIIEYLGRETSTYTRDRITAFLDYRQKRINQIKQVTDGNR